LVGGSTATNGVYVTAFADGTHTFAATVTIPATFVSGSITISSITIDTMPPTVTTGFPVWTDTHTVEVGFTDELGMNLSTVLKTTNYVLLGTGLGPFHPDQVTLVSPIYPSPSGLSTVPDVLVQLTVKLPYRRLTRVKQLRIVGYNYVGTSGTTVNTGVSDVAGLTVQGTFSIDSAPQKPPHQVRPKPSHHTHPYR
jgi:hypothetical protein